VANGTEVCDGADLRGATCASRGYDDGELGCTTCSLDEGLCTRCGNGVREWPEQCDGADLAGETCLSLGFPGTGSLGCAADCQLDTSACLGLNPFALYFDGVDDVVDCGPLDLGLPYSGYTVEAWIRVVDSSPGTVLHKWTDDCSTDPSRTVWVMTGSGAVTLLASGCAGCSCTSTHAVGLTAGAWHHWAYIEYPMCSGVLDGEAVAGCFPTGDLGGDLDDPCMMPIESDLSASAWPVRLGRNDCGGGTCVTLHGYIDEVRIWNYARDYFNVYRDFCALQLAGDEPGLVAYWRFNEGAGDVTVEEVSGTACRLGSVDGADAEDPTWVPDTPF
jgi:hypothetical protein